MIHYNFYYVWINAGWSHYGIICVKHVAAKRAYKLEIRHACAAGG